MDGNYPIGTKYTTRGKHPRTCTVIDVLKTYDSTDTLVRTRYVAMHEMCGQSVKDHDVARTTIDLGNPVLPCTA